MIVGRIELLTARRVAGWVREGDQSNLPIKVRVRDESSVLVEIRTDPTSAKAERQDGCGHPFYIDLPARLAADHVAQLTIEAARSHDSNWTILNKPGAGQAVLANPQSSLANVPKPAQWSSSGIAPYQPWMSDFWSDEPIDPISYLDSRPVFIIGAARSGTSVVGLALRRATRYRGFKEGHLLELGLRFADTIAAYFAHKDQWMRAEAQAGYHLGRIPPSRVLAETMELLRRLTAGYTTQFWFDKTPGHPMVASAPILARTWPNARFLFMKRRGLENLKSRRHKFRNDFAVDCRVWAGIMSEWRAVRDVVGDRAIELDQRALLDEPGFSATRIGALLELTPDEVDAFAAVLGQERPQVTDPTHRVIADIAELGWSDDEIETFRAICGPEMDAYGYTYDARYSL
jgi:hypothetical protein